MERNRIEEIRWLLDDHLDELEMALRECSLEEDEESLGEKIANTEEVIKYLDELLQVEAKPNRVVVEVKGGMVADIRAERPGEVVVVVYASTDTLEFPYSPKTFGGPNGLSIKQLNTVKEEA